MTLAEYRESTNQYRGPGGLGPQLPKSNTAMESIDITNVVRKTSHTDLDSEFRTALDVSKSPMSGTDTPDETKMALMYGYVNPKSRKAPKEYLPSKF